MKKTLWTICLFAGVASASDVVFTLPNSGLLSHGTFFYANQGITNLFDKAKGLDYGAHAGNNGGSGGSWTDTPGTEGYWSVDETKTSGQITLAGRNGTQGESFVLVLGKDIAVGSIVSSVTLTATVPIDSDLNSKTLIYGVGIGTATSLTATKNSSLTMTSTEAGSIDITLSLGTPYTWTEGSKIVAVIGGPMFTPPESTYDITNISVSAEITAASVPEPATATLSLLALAGLAASRRRK
ncbi:MAG: PEP-CTERM sorting domain-containing protein [Akkermansia sp.]